MKSLLRNTLLTLSPASRQAPVGPVEVGQWMAGQPAAGPDQGTSPGRGANSKQGPLRMQAGPSTPVAAQLKMPSSELIRGNGPQTRSLQSSWPALQQSQGRERQREPSGRTPGQTAQLRERVVLGQRGTQTELEGSPREVPAPESLWLRKRHLHTQAGFSLQRPPQRAEGNQLLRSLGNKRARGGGHESLSSQLRCTEARRRHGLLQGPAPRK